LPEVWSKLGIISRHKLTFWQWREASAAQSGKTPHRQAAKRTSPAETARYFHLAQPKLCPVGFWIGFVQITEALLTL
jgi:hypothetical protein